ncbi:hypothetical protein DESC_780006 [Desulfosarcina cetonica]|nr:hypothetical protein DESC_780006 [Desulfosarcina cetonica]
MYVGFQLLIVGAIGAGLAKHLAVEKDFFLVPDHDAAGFAAHLEPGGAGHVVDGNIHLNRHDVEQNIVGHSFIGRNLLLAGIGDLRRVFMDPLPGGFRRDNAVGNPTFQIDKRGRHDAVIHKLQGAPAQLDTGDVRDGIRGTAIDFNIDDEFFDLGELAGVVQTDEIAAQHSHANAHHLSGAQMAVGFGRSFEQGFEIFHVVLHVVGMFSLLCSV